jgi:hypothetical protein
MIASSFFFHFMASLNQPAQEVMRAALECDGRHRRLVGMAIGSNFATVVRRYYAVQILGVP